MRTPRRLRLARGSITLAVAAAATALGGGVVLAIVGIVAPAAFVETEGDTGCTDPPCGPESLPSPDQLLVSLPSVLPVLLAALAVLLAAAAATVVATSDGWRAGVPHALVAGAPLLLLLGAEALPHVLTPCWAGEIPQVCVATRDGVDYADSVHALGHAVLGWAPLTLVYVWALRRARPDLLPRWVPGAATERGPV